MATFILTGRAPRKRSSPSSKEPNQSCKNKRKIIEEKAKTKATVIIITGRLKRSEKDLSHSSSILLKRRFILNVSGNRGKRRLKNQSSPGPLYLVGTCGKRPA